MNVPEDWSEAIEATAGGPVRRVLVIGATDVGKSSFCRALFDHAALHRRKAALVDADVGQKVVGPPAAVTRCYAAEPCSMEALVFVGTTNPVRGFASVIHGTRRLSDSARADLVIVNTSGLLSGPGRALKKAKIGATSPDLIVAIGSHKGLDAILTAHQGLPVVRLAPSPLARRKTKAEKRLAREDSFRRYFEGAVSRSIAGGRLQDGHWPDLLDGLLVGLADRQGNDLALGIVRGVDADRNRIHLLAPNLKRHIHAIVPGKLRLDVTGRELPF